MVQSVLQSKDIFLDALECATPGELIDFLDKACGDDRALRGRVEELLRAHCAAADFLPDRGRTKIDHDTLAECVGETIGPYKLLEQIGEGGMGVVFMAEQVRPVHRTVALKIIKPGMDSRQVIVRFEAEREALARMDHPNIARVIDAGATDTGRPYFVMDLVKGVPITNYCDDRQLSVEDRLKLFVPVCRAVQHAHQKGIIHRDLKPSNVLVAEYDGHPVPKIIDFGVAKATSTHPTEQTLFTRYGQIIGTFEYMSPEQACFNQLDVDTRTDIYSLGVLLYELLTGSTPFDQERLQTVPFDETLRIIRDEDPEPPSSRLNSSARLPAVAAHRQSEPARLSRLIRGELDWIVMKALEKDRNQRYETAAALANDVQRYLNDEPVKAGPPSKRYRFAKFARRNMFALVALTAVVLSLLLGTIISSWQATVAHRAEALAELRLRDEIEARRQASALSNTLQELLRSADPYEGMGVNYTVRQMLDDFSSRLSDKLQDQPATKAALHATIGQTYRQLGLTEKAEPHLKEALELRRKTFGTDHELVVHSLMDRAWLYHARNELAQMEQVAREALAMQQRLGSRDSALMLANLHLLVQSTVEQRRFDDAEQFALQALEIARTHPHALPGEASIRRAMSEAAVDQGDFVKAERLAREALAIHRSLNGENHSATGSGWAALGNSLYTQRKFEEAETCYRNTVAILARSHGYCSAYILRMLATILDAKNDQAALQELRPLADAEDEILGPGGWRKSFVRGSLRAKLGDWNKAESYLAEAAELAPVDAAQDCASADYLVALLHLRDGDDANYRDTCTAALERQAMKRDPAYHLVIWACLIAPDSGVDASRLVSLAESGLTSQPGDPDWLMALGAALYRSGRWEEANATLSKAVDAFDSVRAATRCTPACAHLFLAMTDYRLGQRDQAQKSLTAAIKLIESPPSANESDYGGMSWDRRLVEQLLRQEATRLLGDVGEGSR